MKYIVTLFVLLFSLAGIGQVRDSISKIERTVMVDDPYYREDQFYVGIAHSILLDRPNELKQNSISTGVTFGFLRDFPLNKQRNVAIAPGIGLAFHNLRNNILHSPTDGTYIFTSNFQRNHQNITYLEIPLEFRWRTSTRYSHKFWRIYTGVKYSYMLSNVERYKGSFGDLKNKKNPDYNRSNVGIYLSAGFNTWNVYAYYGMLPLYKKGTMPDNKNIHLFNIGLMFYIL